MAQASAAAYLRNDGCLYTYTELIRQDIGCLIQVEDGTKCGREYDR